MDSLTNFSQSPKIVIVHLEIDKIPYNCMTLRSLTHIQTSALFSYFETLLVVVNVPYMFSHIF